MIIFILSSKKFYHLKTISLGLVFNFFIFILIVDMRIFFNTVILLGIEVYLESEILLKSLDIFELNLIALEFYNKNLY